MPCSSKNNTIDEEQALVLILHGALHGVLQQLNGNLHGHNCTLLDVRLDHLAELAPRAILLLTQQVAGTQVLEAIVGDKLRALRSLARTRATEDEDNGDLVRRPERAGTRCSAEVLNRRHGER
jgi:hypothetical protein